MEHAHKVSLGHNEVIRIGAGPFRVYIHRREHDEKPLAFYICESADPVDNIKQFEVLRSDGTLVDFHINKKG